LKKYDVVLGMGSMCSCSQALREAGLQLVSFPFDWNGGPGICGKTDLIMDDFRGFLDRGRMFRQPEPKFSYNQYWDDDRAFKYYHDFPMACDFEEELPKVRAKYARRISRMYDLFGKAKNVLLVYIACPDWQDCTVEDAVYCRCRLAERWPGVQFDFLLFHYEKGLSFRHRRDEPGEGCRTVAFDYQDRKEDGWFADYRLIGKWLAKQYAVVDYRTPAEREAWENRDRKEQYERFKANNVFQLLLNKSQFKLYKHLRKRLERKGIV